MGLLHKALRSFLNDASNRSFHDNRPYESFTKKAITNRRFGYRQRSHEQGLMPRLTDQNNQVKSTIHHSPKPDEFHPKKALFGQNDYIDILGNGSIKPHELLREMPWWLRGFKEGSELHMLQRLQAVKDESWRWNRPQKWKEVQSRLDFLYRYLNYKHKPPHPSKY